MDRMTAPPHRRPGSPPTPAALSTGWAGVGATSDSGRSGGPGLLLAFLVLALLAPATAPDPASAQLRMTQQEALRLAFPPPVEVARSTAFLEESDLDSLRALAGEGVRVERTVVPYYVGLRDGEPVGVAYFDVHRVRTLPEVLMFVVSLDGRIERVEVLRFREPPEYMAPEGWLEQLVGRGLTPALSLKGDVVNITGATLTAEAVTSAARRVLAYHELIRPFEEGST